MKILELKAKSRGEVKDLRFCVEKMVNAGYTGRSQETVWKHIHELKEKGVPAPEEIPTLYPVASYLIMVDEKIEVVEEETSGEAEYVLLIDKNEIFVGVGSDHTDRRLEGTSILKAKQICPNVISREVWLYSDVKDHWDNLELRSWVVKNEERILYQESTLSELLTPDDLIAFVTKKLKGDKELGLQNMIIFSGTVPTKFGGMMSGSAFEVELYDPLRKDSLWCKYKVEMLDYLSYGGKKNG